MNELKATFYLKKNETRADGITNTLGKSCSPELS